MALNIKNMRKWVKALRSGDYTQTNGALKDDKGFCCLGVVCDISGKGAWANLYPRFSQNECYKVCEGDESDTELPKGVQKWLGIKSENPRLRFGHERESASHINDSLEADFNKIADAIERTWPQIKYKKSAKRA